MWHRRVRSLSLFHGLVRSSLVPRVQFSEPSGRDTKREQEDVTTCRGWRRHTMGEKWWGVGVAWRPKFRSDPIQYDPTRGVGEGGGGGGGESARTCETRVACVCVCSRHRNRTFKSPLYKGSGLVCPQRPLAVPSGIGLWLDNIPTWFMFCFFCFYNGKIFFPTAINTFLWEVFYFHNHQNCLPPLCLHAERGRHVSKKPCPLFQWSAHTHAHTHT